MLNMLEDNSDLWYIEESQLYFETDDLDFLSSYFGEPLPKDTFYIYQGSSGKRRI